MRISAYTGNIILQNQLVFGSALDTNLYRGAANALMTDNAMIIAQGSASYAKTVLSLSQADIDDTFVDFKGTSAADKTKSISTSTVGNFTYTGMVRVDVNGTQYWMPYYA
jgi:hypothetical protein